LYIVVEVDIVVVVFTTYLLLLVTSISTEQTNFDMETTSILVKLPPFWTHNPRLWFAEDKAQFHLHHISAFVTKYFYVILSLPDSVTPDVDVLLEPVRDKPYETLKSRLLKRYGQSDDDRFNALTTPVAVGDMKPSQLLREMRQNCGKDLNPNTFFFQKHFLQRLPLNIQMILRANTYSNVEEMAKKADELLALNSNSLGSVYAVKGQSGDRAQTLEQRIEDLEECLALDARVQVARDRKHLLFAIITGNSGHRPASAMGKRTARDLMAVGSPDRRPRCLFFCPGEKAWNELPGGHRTTLRNQLHTSDIPHLTAANGTCVDVISSRGLTVDLSLARQMKWKFIVARIRQPILGADFLRHFGLLVDLKHHRLIDMTSWTFSNRLVKISNTKSISCLRRGSDNNDKILKKFASLTSCFRTSELIAHSIQHHILMHRPPIFLIGQCRRCKTFTTFYLYHPTYQQQLGITADHSSKKQLNTWRPCGDCRLLNSVTKPDRYPIPNINDFVTQLSGQTIFSIVDQTRHNYWTVSAVINLSRSA
ncbi:hypothetical protein T10_10012, partial [Trichinella papuae]